MHKKTILHYISGKGMGGPKTMFLAYQKLLHSAGYRAVAVHKKNAEIAEHLSGNETRELNYVRSPLFIFQKNKVQELLEELKPDLVLLHKPIDAYFFRSASKDVKIALVVHGFQSKFLECADVLIAVSQAVYEHIKHKHRAVSLIPNFIDIKISNHKIAWNKSIKFGALGFFRRKKGFTDLIKAMALLEKKTKKDFSCELCGYGRFSMFLKFLKFFYQLKKFKILLWNNNPMEWIASKDVIIVPSRSESFGLVVIEAMSQGALVIATKTQGPKSIITENKTGILVNIKDTENLSNAMKQVLEKPKDLLKIRNNARKFAQENFSINSAEKKVVELIEKHSRGLERSLHKQ